MTKEEYQAERAMRAKVTDETLKATDQSHPTPSQEELDLMRLGLMHPDEMTSGAPPPHAATPPQRPPARPT